MEMSCILERTIFQIDAGHCGTLPTLQEVELAVANRKSHKSPGADGIPAEVWKHGGPTTTERLLELISRIWDVKEVPQQWKDAKLISIFKKKGDGAVCENSRGIAMLSFAGEILAKIMRTRLNKYITEFTSRSPDADSEKTEVQPTCFLLSVNSRRSAGSSAWIFVWPLSTCPRNLIQ